MIFRHVEMEVLEAQAVMGFNLCLPSRVNHFTPVKGGVRFVYR